MPWDGTELRVLRLDTGEVDVLLGGTEESVLQPEWIDDETLRVISDRSGWWNLYRVNLFGEVAPVRPIDADFGAPLWQLGAVWHVELDAGTVLTTRTVGTDTLALLDPAPVRCATSNSRTSRRCRSATPTDVGSCCAAVVAPASPRVCDCSTSVSARSPTSGCRSTTCRTSSYLPEAQALTFEGPEREVHALVYAPRNPNFVAPEGNCRRTSRSCTVAPPRMSRPRCIWCTPTSQRGIGVVDVNYGGSSGFGREYRNRLRGQWGIVDVEDTVSAVRGLADAGLADPTVSRSRVARPEGGRCCRRSPPPTSSRAACPTTASPN